MEDIFKPASLTIKQLFGNADALYQIPRYQRPYSWGEDQLDKLWDDLIEAQENDPNYFLGSIITAKPENSANYLDIVDGQQRLTTLLILLCVIRDLYPDINQELLEEDPFSIDAAIIKSSIKFNDRFERLRLVTHPNHGADFKKLVLDEGSTANHQRPYKKDLRKEEEPKFKFINTACFFREKLTDIGRTEAGELLNYLFNQVKIIRIDCQSVPFAIKLFQVLNDRGLDLSNSDLIKSFLIGRIHKIYAEDSEVKKHNEDQFMDDWKSCETIAVDTGESLNELFVVYEYYLLGENPKKSLYDELIKLFEDKDPNEVIADFKNFLYLFKHELYDKEDPLIYSFWYLRWGMYWRSILLAALHHSYPDYTELAKTLQRYYYLNWIAGNTLTKIKQTSFNLIKSIKENKNIAEINEELEKGLQDNNTISRAIENLKGSIYYDAWSKPLLFLLEYQQQDNPNFYWMDDRNIHTEHILPVAFERNAEWSAFHGNDEMKKRVNTGANLTLLSGKKNIAASNNGFEKKIKAYDGTGFHDNSDSKISSFKITQKIVEDYNRETFAREWNNDAMDARWKWFCEQVSKLLDIDIND
ncbi:MAG TPA: DUF262 domain-containing HNH endonuclease family protein [Pyrinomonadaceae bacterium]|nr:DUF262 domain-containing HNH endonuclease family protein [Pyrinomonadaceae bacterium]